MEILQFIPLVHLALFVIRLFLEGEYPGKQKEISRRIFIFSYSEFAVPFFFDLSEAEKSRFEREIFQHD